MVVPTILPTGVSTAFLFPTQIGGSTGFTGIISATPPNVNTPIFFEPSSFITGGGIVLWIIITGPPPNWGGAQIWASVDQTTYGELGIITTGGVQGILTAPFPSDGDPDTTDTLAVDVSESGGQIIGGSTTDADVGFTLAYVDGELVGFSSAVLTSTFHYNLDTYLRRGMFGTTNGSHAVGSQFGLLDTTVFVHTYPANLVGRTIYFKFPSFNTVGGNVQSLANVQVYPYILTGKGLLANWVQSFSVGGKFTDIPQDEWDSNYEIFDVQAPTPINFAANFGGSPTPGCEVAPASTATLTFQTIHNGVATTIGTLVINSGQTTGTYSCSTFTLNAGDRIRLYAPTAVDTTIVGLFGTIVGTR